jgi:hypothetical protein
MAHRGVEIAERELAEIQGAAGGRVKADVFVF